MRITRADRSVLSDWWFTVDRLMFFALLLLMGAGLVLSFAASPPIAARYNLEPFYFVRRQAAMLVPAIIIMFAASTLNPKQIRRASLIIFVTGIALMVVILAVGPEIKGAKRWIELGPFSLQPSEFVKPAFVVLTAWLFNEAQKRRDVPGIELAVALYAVFAVLLVMQPDFGQTLLVTLVWGALVFMAGINLIWIGALGAAGVVGIFSAYFLAPHVASRIDRFLNPASGDTYQTDRSLESFLHGGWFGRGPGEGTVKDVLPDSHTDFIFAVAAEEYGLIACLVLVALFAFIVLRGLSKASQEPDGFIRHAIAGLIMLFGLQALINMAVNVGMLPAKGMTLPFISYGGSSLLAMALTMGFALGLTRKRPMAGQLKRSPPGEPESRNAERKGEGRVSLRPILLAAGGTGGHLFPAAALAQELARRGYSIELATDIRAEKYGVEFPARAIHRIPSATMTSKNPVALARTFWQLGTGYVGARNLLKGVEPLAVIGFGGYPTLPPIIAARSLKIPTAIHEQNAVMGRANRLLARIVDRVALSFPETKKLHRSAQAKARVTGTPVRDAVAAYRDVAYTAPEPASRLLILIFGGSQGAHFFSELLPQALGRLPSPFRWRLTIVQQAREEDLASLRQAYKDINVAAHVATFFRDLPERIATAHLVIARSGASTVAELMAIGRPCILVPLPHALDNDQLENATRLQDGGGGWCIRQDDLTPERLAREIERLFGSPELLAKAAAKAKAMAETNAVKKLADLAEELARENP